MCKADQHVLSADGPGGAQYLTIEVGGALSQGVGHCLTRLCSSSVKVNVFLQYIFVWPDLH